MDELLEELTDLMEGKTEEVDGKETRNKQFSLEGAVEQIEGDQRDIDSIDNELHRETRVVVVDELKEKMEKAENLKTEHVDMTKSSLHRAKSLVETVRKGEEESYNNRLLEDAKKARKQKEMLDSMIERADGDEHKIQVARESYEKASQNREAEKSEMIKEHFALMEKFDGWDKQIDSWAAQIGMGLDELTPEEITPKKDTPEGATPEETVPEAEAPEEEVEWVKEDTPEEEPTPDSPEYSMDDDDSQDHKDEEEQDKEPEEQEQDEQDKPDASAKPAQAKPAPQAQNTTQPRTGQAKPAPEAQDKPKQATNRSNSSSTKDIEFVVGVNGVDLVISQGEGKEPKKIPGILSFRGIRHSYRADMTGGIDPVIIDAIDHVLDSKLVEDGVVDKEKLAGMREAYINYFDDTKEKVDPSELPGITYDRTDLDYLKPKNVFRFIARGNEYRRMRDRATEAEKRGIATVIKDEKGPFRERLEKLFGIAPKALNPGQEERTATPKDKGDKADFKRGLEVRDKNICAQIVNAKLAKELGIDEKDVQARLGKGVYDKLIEDVEHSCSKMTSTIEFSREGRDSSLQHIYGTEMSNISVNKDGTVMYRGKSNDVERKYQKDRYSVTMRDAKGTKYSRISLYKDATEVARKDSRLVPVPGKGTFESVKTVDTKRSGSEGLVTVWDKSANSTARGTVPLDPNSRDLPESDIAKDMNRIEGRSNQAEPTVAQPEATVEQDQEK